MGRIARYKDDQERAIKEAVERERMKNMTEEERKALERERHMVRQACRGKHALRFSGLDGLAIWLQRVQVMCRWSARCLRGRGTPMRQACCSRIQCVPGEQPGRPPCRCTHRVSHVYSTGLQVMCRLFAGCCQGRGAW